MSVQINGVAGGAESKSKVTNNLPHKDWTGKTADRQEAQGVSSISFQLFLCYTKLRYSTHILLFYMQSSQILLSIAIGYHSI